VLVSCFLFIGRGSHPITTFLSNILPPTLQNKIIDAKSFRNGVFERPPSVTTVQALSLMAIYEGICSGENSIESTWALMGLACKLAQSVSFLFHYLSNQTYHSL
jgi:hypothetical protein